MFWIPISEKDFEHNSHHFFYYLTVVSAESCHKEVFQDDYAMKSTMYT